jgi:hypothetical protein
MAEKEISEQPPIIGLPETLSVAPIPFDAGTARQLVQILTPAEVMPGQHEVKFSLGHLTQALSQLLGAARLYEHIDKLVGRLMDTHITGHETNGVLVALVRSIADGEPREVGP